MSRMKYLIQKELKIRSSSETFLYLVGIWGGGGVRGVWGEGERGYATPYKIKRRIGWDELRLVANF